MFHAAVPFLTVQLVALALAAGCGSGSGASGSSVDSDAGAEAARDDSGGSRLDSGRYEAGSDGGGADASRSEAGADDAGEDASTCGGTICYAGQTCVSGQCGFVGCSGVNVPGDYATVQAAITGLGSVGGTICLAAQTYSESLGIDNFPPYGATLTIQGVSSSRTSITALLVEAYGSPSVTVRGVSFGSLRVDTSDGYPVGTEVNVSVTASKLGSFSLTGKGSTANVTLDGVDVSGMKLAMGDDGVKFNLTVKNSYIHDASDYGLQATSTFETANGGTANIRLINDTFANNGTAIAIGPSYTTSQLFLLAYVSNDLIVNNTLGIDGPLQGATNNALFGNTTNYSGGATTGSGYVTTDPKLDPSTVPPGLLPSSPCRGAGDSTQAPPEDFWGRPRGGAPDIGAVQSSP